MPKGIWKRKTRPIEIPIGPSIAIVHLTRGLEAIIDAVDAPLIGQWNWYVSKGKGIKFYAVREFYGGKATRMHGFILGLTEGEEGDHKNGDTLDNRRANLRHATRRQNIFNRGAYKTNLLGVKGISPRENGKYRARIQVNKKQINLGHFDNIDDARAAYARAAIELHGEFARL